MNYERHEEVYTNLDTRARLLIARDIVHSLAPTDAVTDESIKEIQRLIDGALERTFDWVAQWTYEETGR